MLKIKKKSNFKQYYYESLYSYCSEHTPSFPEPVPFGPI